MIVNMRVAVKQWVSVGPPCYGQMVSGAGPYARVLVFGAEREMTRIYFYDRPCIKMAS